MKKRKNTAKRRATAAVRRNKAAMLAITFVVLVLLAVLVCEGYSLSGKLDANDAKLAGLEEQIADEEQRTEEIQELQEYMQSDEYLEKAAKEKLGLVRENEIIFKESQ